MNSFNLWILDHERGIKRAMIIAIVVLIAWFFSGCTSPLVSINRTAPVVGIGFTDNSTDKTINATVPVSAVP